MRQGSSVPNVRSEHGRCAVALGSWPRKITKSSFRARNRQVRGRRFNARCGVRRLAAIELPYGRPLALVRWKNSLASAVENETRTGILALEVRQPSGNAGEECTDAAPHDQRERLLERKFAPVDFRLLREHVTGRRRTASAKQRCDLFGRLRRGRDLVGVALIQ